jgi:bifunctional non-homologous end joining protein LigD
MPGLQTYRAKRQFGVTPEPRGTKARAKGHAYVVQKHAARRLHYDLRLELDGVMKSWAVTRGPSMVPGEKRLAVHVEDHPIEYNAFEGTIPKGQYGGGTVMIWDRGQWLPEGDPHKAYKKGHLEFRLEGDKLRGRWHLVRMRKRSGERQEPWLLIKAADEDARTAKDPDILEEKPLSAVTGRDIDEIAAGKPVRKKSARATTPAAAVWHSNRKPAGATTAARPRERKVRTASKKTQAAKRGKRPSASSDGAEIPGARPAPLPDFVPPCLTLLSDTAPDAPNWIHEIKFDGYRMQARLAGGKVQLKTRRSLDWTGKFQSVAAALAALPARQALIDGEIVVEDERGISNFAMLQAALKEGRRDAFVYCVFDLLHLDGRDLRDSPLRERKAELQDLLKSARGIGDVIRYSEHFDEDGALVLQQACRMTLEGIVSKRADAPYRSGRTDTFIKTKCSNAQEFVAGGYSPSTALPRAIGALAVGHYDHGRLVYAGRIGTGYTQAMARDLWKRLHPLEVAKPPFDQIPRAEARRRDVRWVEPTQVVEAHFRGWTTDGLVRQAAFKGVREDKPAKDVVRELPATIDSNATTAGERAQAAKVAAEATKIMAKKSKGTTKVAKRSGKAGAAKRRTKSTPLRAKPATEGDVRFTHPDRVYWVDVGVTKQDLADYYRSVWDQMAPHVVNRPLALVRCPDGTTGQCFFQKHASAGLSEQKLRIVIDRKRRQIIAVDDIDGLLSLVQAGVLEVHVRGSLIDRLDLCDRIVFDIDPGQDMPWAGVLAAARDVRERLDALDLESFVKLSGGKGLHVVLPIEGADWDTAKAFAQTIAFAMAADQPERYVAKMTKSLRKGKIFIDYFRNSLEQTSVAAFSTRARDGAPVSVPVTWDELGRAKSANQYTLFNIGKRLSAMKRDPWADLGRVKQKLPDLATLRKRP